MKTTKDLALSGIFLSFSLILSYIESFLPISFGIPYIKIGLVNIIVLISLYKSSASNVFVIQLLRVIIVSIVSGNIFALQFSFFGFIASFLVMYLLKNYTSLNIIVISCFGAICHNIAQLLTAALVLENTNILNIAPLFIIIGIFTGLIIGVITYIIFKRIN